MNELVELGRKAAGEWQNDDAYHQAAVIINALCDELEGAHKECIKIHYDYPSLSCLNCGSKHYNFVSKHDPEGCKYCRSLLLTLTNLQQRHGEPNMPTFKFCPMCGRKL